ncbi:ABC transporter permease [Clostridium thermosuccinogenes]|uniref:ABC transporter permease n=2 Tax=Clostridium thermosuccinogenes TaxID=84032 RepID=A0A2K2F6N2_9CLOT|nr:ABC transporter permease [Pseudoclostridium thermosuccinogenes]PNT94439.1 ABC transporter permease [Pseudoclostridium thermosuccinogenes]PNT97916.1 ABC transporter permease [Pseudoclostridium thermosuccinogenes]PNT99848.1 ABC transporter permease [Pseudoclostridium thermosuccinogenes]
MVLPMVYAISNSLKPLEEIWYFPPRFFVRNPTLKNFRDLFRIMSESWVPFSRYIFNTFLITGVGTFGHVVLASLCAYALSKHDFPGKNLMFSMVVLSLMFSGVVTQIPNFIIVAKLGWIDSYKAIIIPAFGSSLGLYLMKQFMEQMIPDSVLESARMDGAHEWKVFWKIVMPLVKPAWLTLTIFSIQGLWGMGANKFIQSEELKTLNYALSQILAGGIARAGTGSAAAVLMMIVPIVAFIITQSNVIETMSTSGMKD